MLSGFIEGIIGLIFSLFQSVATGIIQLFFPQLSDVHKHFQENWKRYATFALYFFLTASLLGGLFLFCLLLAYFFNSWLSFGMQIQRIDVDFDMARENGLKWGYDAPTMEDSQFEEDLNEFILSKESASSFGRDRDSSRYHHYEDDDSYSEFIDTIKRSKKEIYKLKNKLKSQAADSMRCVQKASVPSALSQGVEFSLSISFVTPESHYQRLEANTPLQVVIGDHTIIKPIPTPSRSYLLSTFRTIFYSPYLILGLMPETNDIEISLYGGANKPFKSQVTQRSIELIVESCDLQILDATLVITPTISWFQSALGRFPLLSLFFTASVFNGLALIAISASGLVYVHLSSKPSEKPTKRTSSTKDPNSNVENISTVPDSLSSGRKSFRQDTDSWSECSDSPVS